MSHPNRFHIQTHISYSGFLQIKKQYSNSIFQQLKFPCAILSYNNFTINIMVHLYHFVLNYSVVDENFNEVVGTSLKKTLFPLEGSSAVI